MPWGSAVCVPVVPPSVPFVTVPFSSVNVVCDVVFSDSDGDPVSLQQTRCVFVESQDNVDFDGVLVKAPLATRRKVTPPTPQQCHLMVTSLQTRLRWPGPKQESPAEGTTMEVRNQACCSGGMEYGGEQWRTARDRAVIARKVQYLNDSDSMKVEIDELETCLLGPEE